ncbi:glutamate racemase [Capnocytophaga haemolytica]|jgi:glutamate racemase|uniref:Glutamate racemase n=1 Tax=Capnocytophaga haemolytica TaxID=45243 RepID=A0AAX2H255_9FLAO|nr:glutamate racemase [Capnocytophaga haemolytica]AMD85895.1 glutamate racemase [Capnocytophaga haemolytica]SFO03781.1 glutamate racemase [Capnocytophaga haemolytica]SNV15390.1 Glutamate racemase [Capnocytophaga haemolytica]
MKNENPIGLFDSGVGGTTIWREVVTLMPCENTLFLADSANAPYGEKSKEEITRLSDVNTQYLLDHGAKIIVVACNTATTAAISYLRAKYKQVPFIGIEPAIKPASLNSKSKKIGVLATRSTLASDLFAKTSNQMAEEEEVQIIERVGEGLVDLIESGQINSPKMTELLRQYLLPMVAEGIDYLVLGCTHYPYLLPQIKAILPPHIEVIDSGYAVAKQTRNVLQQRDLLTKHTSQGRHTWLTSGKVEILKGFAPDFVEIRKIESRRAEVRN